MSKFSLDNIVNFKPPQAWIDKALELPQKQQNREPTFFSQYGRILAASICIISVALPISIFCIKNNNLFSVIPVVETTSSTEQTNVESTIIATDVTQPPTQAETKDIPSITQNPATQPPTEAITPTQIEFVTGEDWGTGEEIIKDDNFNPSGTASSSDSNSYNVIKGKIKLEYFEGYDTIYCRILDTNFNLIGDSNLYSDQHIAQIVASQDGYVYFYYDPFEKGVVRKAGLYRYEFYLADGEDYYYGLISLEQ